MTIPLDPIRTPRCRIDPLQIEDAAALQSITDASVTERVHFLPEPFTLADARALIVGSTREDRFLAVRSPEGATLLGVIGVHEKRERAIEIGYWFAATARGKGLATEALRAVTAQLASLNPDRRIVAECHSDNRRSWALLERIGFVPAGTAGERPGRRLLVRKAEAGYRIDVC